MVEAVAEPGREAQRVEDRVEEAGVAQVREGGDTGGQGAGGGGGVARVVSIHCARLPLTQGWGLFSILQPGWPNPLLPPP
jgi:hypothetical protein